mgnify:CR=1 FL=1
MMKSEWNKNLNFHQFILVVSKIPRQRQEEETTSNNDHIGLEELEYAIINKYTATVLSPLPSFKISNKNMSEKRSKFCTYCKKWVTTTVNVASNISKC